jgi:DNA primase large subunit
MIFNFDTWWVNNQWKVKDMFRRTINTGDIYIAADTLRQFIEDAIKSELEDYDDLKEYGSCTCAELQDEINDLKERLKEHEALNENLNKL